MSNQDRFDGRLGALLETTRHDAVASDAKSPPTIAIVQMNVDALKPGRYQPRQQLSEDPLAELADSIREQGVLQPLVVRRIEAAGETPDVHGYEIVAGERRWQAAKLVGLATVPVIVRELDDQSALAVALIENLQREDLNAIDQARSLSRLADEFELTHEQVARAVGRSRASVSNLLRLLDLNDEVQHLLANGRIDMGHARALLPLDTARQVSMARRTATRGLSVRQVEKAVRDLLAVSAERSAARSAVDLQTLWLQRQIEQELGQKITLRPDKNGGYALSIGFDDLAQLQDALHRVQELIGQVRNTAGPRTRDTRSAEGTTRSE